MTDKKRTANYDSSDLWVEWSGTGGTFTLHRNNGRPVFPLTEHEVLWLDKQIAFIYNRETYSIRGTTESQGLAIARMRY